MDERIYDRLIEKFNEFPSGMPKRDLALEFLKALFTEEEAKVGAEMPISPTPLPSVCEQLGRDEEEIKPLLENMADKGLVYHVNQKGTDYYSLFPLMPGIFEHQMMKGEVSEHSRKVADLHDRMYYSGWGDEFFSLKTQMARVIPIEKKIESGSEILPYESVSKMIDNEDSISLSVCYCKQEKELLGRPCSVSSTKETCMIFGAWARYLVERGFGREITKEEAYAVLERAEKDGLVHLTDNTREGYRVICNCCTCCCGILNAITKLNKPRAVATSHFIVEVNTETCDGCGTCIERCVFGARSIFDDVSTVNPEKCLGCGLCTTDCPTGSLTMVRRKDDVETKRNLEELVGAMLEEKAASEDGK